MQAQSYQESVANELPAKVRNLLSMKGQFMTLLYGKECKVRKGSPAVHKFSKMVLRAGIEYDNIKAVIAKRLDGELPAENAGLSWGAYVPGLYPYIIEHKGELYFRFFTVPNSQKVSPTFVCNGKEITRSEAEVFCLASEFQERETTLETITLKIAGIMEVNGAEV
jgi:hypothetical protein